MNLKVAMGINVVCILVLVGCSIFGLATIQMPVLIVQQLFVVGALGLNVPAFVSNYRNYRKEKKV